MMKAKYGLKVMTYQHRPAKATSESFRDIVFAMAKVLTKLFSGDKNILWFDNSSMNALNFKKKSIGNRKLVPLRKRLKDNFKVYIMALLSPKGIVAIQFSRFSPPMTMQKQFLEQAIRRLESQTQVEEHAWILTMDNCPTFKTPEMRNIVKKHRLEI
jgi:hypothetical protein